MKSKSTHQARLAPGTRLRRMLMQFAILAENDLRRIPKTPRHSVHALRTRMKKLRSILRLAHGQIAPTAGTAITRKARDAKDTFDAVRNQEVLNRLLKKWSSRGTAKIPGQKISDAMLEQVRLLARKLQRLIAALPLDALRWTDLCRAHEKTYRSARRWMKRSASGNPEHLHHWRRRVKDLYYQSLALRHLGGMKRRIRQSHRLGSRLGKCHDLHLLQRCAGAKLSPAELKRVRRLQAELHKKIFAAGTKLFRDKPDHFGRSLS